MLEAPSSGRAYIGARRELLGVIFATTDSDSCERCQGEIRVGDDVFGLPLRQELEQRITGLTVCCLELVLPPSPCAAGSRWCVETRGVSCSTSGHGCPPCPLGEWEAEQRRGSPDRP